MTEYDYLHAPITDLTYTESTETVTTDIETIKDFRSGSKNYWDFTWSIKDLTADFIDIHIEFKYPEMISADDKIEVTFMFEDFEAGMKNFTRIDLQVPYLKTEKEALGSFYNVAWGTLAILGLILFLTVILSVSTTKLILIFGFMNLIVNLCLTDTKIP